MDADYLLHFLELLQAVAFIEAVMVQLPNGTSAAYGKTISKTVTTGNKRVIGTRTSSTHTSTTIKTFSNLTTIRYTHSTVSSSSSNQTSSSYSTHGTKTSLWLHTTLSYTNPGYISFYIESSNTTLDTKIFPFTLYNTAGRIFPNGTEISRRKKSCPVRPRAAQKRCTIHNTKCTIHSKM